ncbi:MAG: hypothetical protein U0872_06860 [Planctomycetaceae bacterium]
MASLRAELLAEVLWELKKINKVATYTEVSLRAGFKPGAGFKTVLTSLEAVKRDWPHLQWWRALPDDGCVERESDHAGQLQAAGYSFEDVKGRKTAVTLADLKSVLYSWEEEPVVAETVA